MSTTIKYKGNTIATISNETKKLTTKGTWLEDDIEIKDVEASNNNAIFLIDTIVVPSDTRAVNIDLSTYLDNYDILIIAQDITLTASDWLYYSPNVDTATGGSYNDGSKINHAGICFWAFPLGGSSKYICGYTANMTFVQRTSAISNLYIYTYVSTKMITANSSFKVYGGNYANL